MKNYISFFIILLLQRLLINFSYSQTLLTSDDFGTTAQNPISRTGWTADPAGGSNWELRTTSPSSGYSWTNPSFSASGGANVFTNLGTNTNTKKLTYDNNLSTIGYQNIKVRFGGIKSGTVPNLNILYSTDGTNYYNAGSIALGTSWAAYTVNLPSAAENVSNLRIRFEITANNNSSNYLRIDDFHVIGTASGWTSVTNGNWNDPTTWNPSTVPDQNGLITINHQVTVPSGYTARILSGGNVTVNTGGTLILSSELDNQVPGGLVIKGTLQINSGGYISGNAPKYENTSTLVYNTSYNVSTEWTDNGSSAGIGIPQNVVIQNSATVNMPNSNRGLAGNININSGQLILNSTSGDLYIGGNWTRASSASFTPNNRAVIFNGSTTQTVSITGGGTETFNYLIVSGSGTLKLSSSPATNITVTSNNGLTLSSTNATSTIDLNGQTLTLSGGGNLSLSNGNRYITSSIANGSLKIINNKIFITNGGSLTTDVNTLVILENGLDCGSGTSHYLTVNGTLQINSGGWLEGHSPKYGSSSTLKYNCNCTYERNLEWTKSSGTIGITEGYPNNVQISNNTILDYVNLTNTGDKEINGNLIIDANSALYMDYGSVSCGGSLIIKGNATINGNFSLGYASGDDLKIYGNLTLNNVSGFSPNNRTIFFMKDGIQTLSANNSLNIPYIILGRAGGSGTTLQLNGIDLSITAPNGGNALTFTNSTDVLDINGRTLTIGTAGISSLISGNGSFKGSTTSKMSLLGNGNIGTIKFTTDLNLHTLTINRTSSGNVTLGSNLTINNTLSLINGTITIGNYNLTIASSATISGTFGTENMIITNGTGELRKNLTAASTITFPIGDNTGTIEYSPATLTFTGGTYSGYVGIRVVDDKHPNNQAITDYITRYWIVTSSGISPTSYNFSGTYTFADINGIETNSKAGRWDGTRWTLGNNLNANSCTITGLTTLPTTNHFTAGNPLMYQEINIKGNNVDISDGDNTPSLSDHTDFGNVDIATETLDRTYTIENLGIPDLILTGNPLVSISGTHASDFSVVTNPSTPITYGNSTTFTIRFNPSATGIRSATISIASNDSDENPYDFAIQGNGVNINACGSEGFNAGTTPPNGWTFTGITGTYTTSGNYGIASPSLKLDNTGDQIITAPVVNPSNLSFWIKGQSTDANSSLLVEGYDGTNWNTIENIVPLPTSGTTKSYSNGISSYTKFRFTYNKSVGNLALDDVAITCANCTTPTTQASNVTFTNIQSDRMTINWTRGSSPGDGVIVLMKQGGNVDADPTDGVSYTASTTFGSGSQIGTGNYVVYIGNGTSVLVTGLNPNTIYYVKVYEKNCLDAQLFVNTNSPANGSQTTALANVTNLQVSCQSSNTATITWTAPSGDYDGVIIGMRNSTLVPHTINDNASNYTANANFGSGTQYGSTTPYSYVVYKGTGTSVTVTGLTAGQNYTIKAYTYKNNTGSIWAPETPTTSITGLAFPNVTNVVILPGNQQLQVSWTPPASSCYDEVMVVCKQNSAVTASPSGDGSSYSANLSYGSGTAFDGGYVVYKGTSYPITITNLTNGTQYCIKIFTRQGTTWSSGISQCATPEEITTLEPGDLAIVAVNTQYLTTGSDDEVCFFSFKNITPGTAIDFTDNGYERLYAEKWGDSEGTIRITRKSGTSTVEAGKVICIRGQGYSSSNFTIRVCGTDDTNNWDITSLNTNGSLHGSYDLNVNDQIWIMQGGSWNNDGDLNDHDAIYTGNVLYGWTATGWKTSPGYDDTKGSTLYPQTECFNTNVQVTAYPSKVKYIGDTTITSQYNWLMRINDSDNWQGYVNNTEYNNAQAGGILYDYANVCFRFRFNNLIGDEAGIWTGAGGTTDWFYCANWKDLRIPDENTNVTLPSSDVINNCVIGAPPTNYTEARCKNLTNNLSSGFSFNINNSNSTLHIYGNFVNNSTFNHTNGSVHFVNPTNNQTISGTSNISFYNLTINNGGTGITIERDITISNTLTLTDGVISTGNNKVILTNSNPSTAISGGNSNSFIYGTLRRYITNNTSVYSFPIGDGTNSTNYKRFDFVNNNLAGVTYIDANVSSLIETGNNIDSRLNITVNGTPMTDLLSQAIWTVNPQTGWNYSTGSYGVRLYVANTGLSSADDNMFCPVKRSDNSTDYADWSTYETTEGTTIPPAGSNGRIYNNGNGYAERTGYKSFSKHAIVKSTNVLPIVLLDFSVSLNSSNNVVIHWTTVSEINNDHFIVERSKDGINFEDILYIKGNNNSNELINYSAIDYHPYEGLSYYRLKQIDNTGNHTYSETRTIYIPLNNENNVTISYDKDKILLNFIVKNETLTYIKLTDINGKTVFEDNIILKNSHDNYSINCNKLSKGVYFINISFNNSSVVSKQILID